MQVDLQQGTLDLMILKALTWDSMHGYGIARWLEQTTDEAVRIEEGSLYPALHRMERRGWIEATWGVSENNRRAKYYTLTSVGREQLKEEMRRWGNVVAVVARVLDANPARV
jgi:PadR family transcriptional regulator, regulatory protein PadR